MCKNGGLHGLHLVPCAVMLPCGWQVVVCQLQRSGEFVMCVKLGTRCTLGLPSLRFLLVPLRFSSPCAFLLFPAVCRACAACKKEQHRGQRRDGRLQMAVPVLETRHLQSHACTHKFHANFAFVFCVFCNICGNFSGLAAVNLFMDVES